jgi:hypothetical protein
LLREVKVDVWLLQESADLVDEGPASVEEDEVGVAEPRVVEEWFKEKGVVACDREVASGACGSVDVDGEVEAAAFDGDVAEEEIL